MPPPYDVHNFLNLLGIEFAGEGDVVVGAASPLHLGSATQVWDATVRNQTTGKKMAAYRCTQLILYPRP